MGIINVSVLMRVGEALFAFWLGSGKVRSGCMEDTLARIYIWFIYEMTSMNENGTAVYHESAIVWSLRSHVCMHYVWLGSIFSIS